MHSLGAQKRLDAVKLTLLFSSSMKIDNVYDHHYHRPTEVARNAKVKGEEVRWKMIRIGNGKGVGTRQEGG